MTEQEIMQLASDAGFDSSFSDYDGNLMICSGGYDEELITDELKRFAALVAEREREACLAEIETGIWLDKTTEEVLADIAGAIRARGEACRLCKGTGERDSGGSQPWGEAITVQCECPCLQDVREVLMALADEVMEWNLESSWGSGASTTLEAIVDRYATAIRARSKKENQQ